jgi:hypothetical protein
VLTADPRSDYTFKQPYTYRVFHEAGNVPTLLNPNSSNKNSLKRTKKVTWSIDIKGHKLPEIIPQGEKRLFLFDPFPF